MPYISSADTNQEDDEQQKKNQAGDAAGTSDSSESNPQLAQSTGSAFGGGNASGSGATTAQKPSSSGQFTNLQSYLDANSDQSPSTAISSKISQHADKAKTDLSDAQSKFNDNVSQSTTQYNPDVIKSAMDDPYAFVKNADNLSAFTKQRDAKYAGDSSLADVGGFDANEGKTIDQEIGATKTEPGQFALLQQMMGRPDYSQGQQNLDQMLLANSSKSRQDFSNLQNNYSGIGSQYDSANKAATQQASQAQATTAQAAQAAHDALYGADNKTGAVHGLETQLTTAAQQAQAAKDAAYARIQAELRGGKISTADLKLVPELHDAVSIWNQDPSKYLSEGGSAATAQNIATDADRARYSALMQLAGQQNTFLPDTSGVNAPGASSAFDPNLIFNSQALAAAAGQDQLAYQQAITNYATPTDSIWGGKTLNLPQMIAQEQNQPKDGRISLNVMPYLQQYLQQAQTQYGYGRRLQNSDIE